MDRRQKAALHRKKAAQLNESWRVGAIEVRYSDDGHWYHTLSHCPAALFDRNGYLFFATERAYQTSPYLRIGKQIAVPKLGISAVLGYVRVIDPNAPPNIDVDIHSTTATEGNRRLVLHLQQERNRTLVQTKKRSTESLDCEVCGFSFGAYGAQAAEYCEVHHLLPLSELEGTTETSTEDLAILCANCHRVVHLQNPPFTLEQVRDMLAR